MASPDLRPVSARALKSAIDTLRPQLSGASVLDLFAGQGRFGMEALKESAAHVTFVDTDRSFARTLEKPLRPYKEKASLFIEDVWGFLKRYTGKFDIVFADPPFRLWAPAFETQLFSSIASVLDDRAILLVKHPRRMVLSPAHTGFQPIKTTQFGESALGYFSYGEKH